MKTVKFDVHGMTCSSCSAHVENAVKKVDGVKSVNVNLILNNMVVEYDEKKANNEKIINAVIDAGYDANVYNGNSKNREEKNISNDKEIKSMKKRLIASICLLIPLMYIAMHHMLFEWFGLPVPQIIKDLFHGPENALRFAVTQLLLVIPIVYLNRNYFIVGFKRLFKISPNMDSLIAIGSSAAIIYGLYAIYMIIQGMNVNNIDQINKFSMDLYFESAGTILTLITVGKYLETKSKGKTSDAINKLINLVPKKVTAIRNEKEVLLKIEEIQNGEIIIIKPGESIGVDGIIIEGNSSVDQSSITGESIPVEKKIGDSVISGTINKNGILKIRATKVGEDTTISQIIKLVEEASNSKAPISRLADKVSGIFVPIVITIAFIATIIWLINGQPFEFALSIGISVLVISCPCALGLATPVAIMVGTGKGAENGILIKSAESLENLHSVDTVVLDKTGTITEGKPKVTDIITELDEEEFLKIAGSLEKNSEHPLAEAILKKVKEKNIKLQKVDKFEIIPGKGLEGTISGNKYLAGNITLMIEKKVYIDKMKTESKKLLEEGKTVLYFANEMRVIGIIAVADTIKETSYTAIKELQKMHLEVAMLTGDNSIVANSIATKLNINKVIAEVLPQDKEKEIANLQAQGKKVAFVGDGINDSPALVKSDVGLAIGSGTDIAIESADLVLIKNNLLDVAKAISLSKAVIRNIKMNLFWAFFYNAIGIPIACGIFYIPFGLKLNPMIGAAAMSLSSVCVVTNALRLRKFKINFKEENKMNEKIIKIEGMHCEHCKMSVEKALNSIPGISKVEVDLENKMAKIEATDNVENEKITDAIEEAGFNVVEIK